MECFEKNFLQCGWQLNEKLWSISGMILTGETEVLGEKHYKVRVAGE